MPIATVLHKVFLTVLISINFFLDSTPGSHPEMQHSAHQIPLLMPAGPRSMPTWEQTGQDKHLHREAPGAQIREEGEERSPHHSGSESKLETSAADTL